MRLEIYFYQQILHIKKKTTFDEIVCIVLISAEGNNDRRQKKAKQFLYIHR